MRVLGAAVEAVFPETRRAWEPSFGEKTIKLLRQNPHLLCVCLRSSVITFFVCITWRVEPSSTFVGSRDHITSRHFISHHIISHHLTVPHITSRQITSHHITSHHITSHHITYITSHHVKSHQLIKSPHRHDMA